ncbi:exonuclease domain-containing protein [Psittacicella hinzii]|uniref:DNA-directed DNA polymerase n=1 Tax=Psittacicella hinzii TaxID=2028575 RepID=A0A3A1YPL3_9GAMM|nr:exonuclease domain-containing protein [Psittacicella hinzii]RIY39189.1 hypothetical protein CKF58_02655 [Psittacicella hinzii]
MTADKSLGDVSQEPIESTENTTSTSSTHVSSFSIHDISNLDAQKRSSSSNIYSSDAEPDYDEDDEDDLDLATLIQKNKGLQGAEQAAQDSAAVAQDSAALAQDSAALAQDSAAFMQGQAQAQGMLEAAAMQQAILAGQQAFATEQKYLHAQHHGAASLDASTDDGWMAALAADAQTQQQFAQQKATAPDDVQAALMQKRGEDFSPGQAITGDHYSENPPVEQEVELPFDYSVYDIYRQQDHSYSQSPPIDFSYDEATFLAKQSLVTQGGMIDYEESEFPLTRFEVELYAQYPELRPDPIGDAFTKHSLEYVKALHAKKFDCYFMDTETTGMTREPGRKPSDGHRIITLGMVPFFNDRLDLDNTEQMVDWVFNPEEVEIEHEAYKVHGFKNKDLIHAPIFHEFVDEFVQRIMGKVLIIHNAPFDLAFLNMELKRAGKNFEVEDICLVIDSLVLARSLYQGRASLDALSERFGVSIRRDLHGALLDSMILADAYIRMLNSLQEEWLIDKTKGFKRPIIWDFDDEDTPPLDPELIALANTLKVTVSEEDLQRHEKFCEEFNIVTTFDLISKAKQLELQQQEKARQEAELAEAAEDEEEYAVEEQAIVVNNTETESA